MYLPRLVIVLTLIALTLPVAAAEKISRLGEYTGYTAPVFSSVEKHTAYIPMHDDVHIALDYFLPTDGPGRDAFPVVFQYTPYQRSRINPETGEVRDYSTNDTVEVLLKHGYAVVVADMRGTGASSGWLHDFMPAIWSDGKEIVDWIAAQPWSNGKVGMMGASYLGWSQTAVASQQPKALKCIMPTVIPLEGYTGEVYPGGIYLKIFLEAWSGGMFYSQRSYYLPDQGMLPTQPAVDEDGDGELHDEIPLDQNGNGTFLDDGFPPQYADGAEREHVYYKAIKAHEENLDYAAWAVNAPFIDSKSPLGYSMYDLGPNAQLENVLASGIPTYHIGGWFDGFTRGTFELFATMRESNPTRAILFPGYHGVLSGPYYEHIGADRAATAQRFHTEHLRFFDHYLKGIPNGIDTEPPLQYYVMHGDGWRVTSDWPPADVEDHTLYFAPDHELATKAQRKGSDDYTADFSHDARFGENGGNRWIGISGRTPKALPVRTEKDQQCLVYTGEALDAALEVTGHPEVTLFASSTAPDGDFFVYLEDVSPTGEAVLVTEAQLRAGFAALHDNDDMINGGGSGIDVLPELPWHGYEEKDYNPAPFADGAVVEMRIDFQPTSWVFRAGHRIRVSIACADYPTFSLHPQLSPDNDPAAENNTLPTITIHRDKKHRSQLRLPVRTGAGVREN